MELTHFTQQTFRTLMTCMSRPGQQETLQKHTDINGLYAETLSVAMTLLDGEIRFATVGQHATLQQELSAWTGAQLTTLEQADFIIIPQTATLTEVIPALQQANIGDLVDPQHGATIIMEVPTAAQKVWSLKGPGIKEETLLKLALPIEVALTRAQRNKEFPLGIDMIFVDDSGQVVALPRTTIVEEVKQ